MVHGFFGRLEYFLDILTVLLCRGDVVPGNTLVLINHRSGTVDAGADTVEIVFAHIQHRQIPYLGHVQRFVEGTLIVGGISQKADGDFITTLPDLETAVRIGTPILIIIFNNGCYGALKHRQRMRYDSRYIGVDFGNPDFTQLAHVFGANGRRVERPGELRSAIEEGLKSSRPYLVDVVVDPDFFPDHLIYLNSTSWTAVFKASVATLNEFDSVSSFFVCLASIA